MVDLTSLLLLYLATDTTYFREHIEAAKAVGPASGDEPTGRSTSGLGRYPVVLLIALQPGPDAFTDQLPHGHFLGFALNLLSRTPAGSSFVSDQFGVTSLSVRYAAGRLCRRLRTFAGWETIVQTAADLLEFHLPALGTVKLHMKGAILYAGDVAIPLSPQHAVAMKMLLPGKAVSHGDFEDKGIKHPASTINRLLNVIRQYGLELALDKSEKETYRLSYATLVS